jgi:hypothetical protein
VAARSAQPYAPRVPWETPRPSLTTTLRPRLLDALGDEAASIAWALRLGLVHSLAARPVLARLFDVDAARLGDAGAVRAILDRLDARFGLVPRSLSAPPLSDAALAAALAAFPAETARALAAPTGLGWLFHELLAHEKAEVFRDFRDASAKIGGARLLPATRLYTPRAIVRFLLENALADALPEASRATLPLAVRGVAKRASRPLDALAVLDPACGAGHMLVEALDLLADAHLAVGARTPAAALAHVLDVQLAGLELDARAADVCALTLRLRACERAEAIVAVEPRIVAVDARVPVGALGLVDPSVETAFARADELGALLPIDGHPDVERGFRALAEHAERVERVELAEPRGPVGERRGVGGLRALLQPRWDVVVTNPPYVGFRKLDRALAEAVRRDPHAEIDLSVAFVSRGFALLREGGVLAAITPAAWTTSSRCEPLRRAILEAGAPRLMVSLGQRVFDDAPLLFVALSLVQRGAVRDDDALITLRMPTGSGEAELARAAARGGRRWPCAELRALPSVPFLPTAPPALLEAMARGARGEQPTIGALFDACDGVWGGSNARDVREAWELPPDGAGWIPASGGQGYARALAPTSRRVRRSLVEGWRGLALRDGHAFEYARVAGGKLAARVAMPASAAIAGVVTMAAREGTSEARVLEAIAVFDARAGTALLRTLTSGLNFNPGYAARIPLGVGEPDARLVATVRAVLEGKLALAASDPTCDAYDPAWHMLPAGDDDLHAFARGRVDAALVARARVLEREAELDAMVSARLGVDPAEIDLGDDAGDDDEPSEGGLPVESELEALARACGCEASALLASSEPALVARVEALRRAAIAELARTWVATSALRAFGHRWAGASAPAACTPALDVATLDEGPGSLLAALRVSPRLACSFADAAGMPLPRFLARDLFREHVVRFRRRPALWQLASEGRKPAFSCFVHAHRCDRRLLERIAGELVARARMAVEAGRHAELDRFARALETVARAGFEGAPYDPDPEDGVRVNVAPLQRAGLLAADVLAPADVDAALADRASWLRARGSARVRGEGELDP